MAEETKNKESVKAEKQKTKNKGKKRVGVSVSSNGRAYITATFNNTLVAITNEKGDTIAWGSAGASGFKGTRRSTPFAATSAMESVAKKALEKGVKAVEVFVKGPGSGRDAGLRAIRSAGLSISAITDITPIPHNGPRAKKKRRV
ncbi:MAG TPA: 30S ribosomal protein S11 [Candidatus Saccharimonadales bacterium]|nr:30S ribosomal protein S11 [Candidatus Saccharimonadales bacterium]